MEVILYSKECNWYTRCCPLNGGVCYRECPLREAIIIHVMGSMEDVDYSTWYKVVLIALSITAFM